MISPEDTPFMSAIGRGKASAVYHEWQKDSLSAVDRTNWQLEGDDVTPTTSAPTTRIGNYCQISRKSWAITGTQEVVDKAGRSSEASYQKAKRGKELRIDIEAIARHRAAYLIAVGGAAYLIAKAIRSARLLAFDDLGMEAIREFVVEDMPVTVAVDSAGTSVHQTGPKEWQARIGKIPVAVE